jgi:hypothetical protein
MYYPNLILLHFDGVVIKPKQTLQKLLVQWAQI